MVHIYTILSDFVGLQCDGQFHEENYLATKHDFMIIMEFLITNELDKTVY